MNKNFAVTFRIYEHNCSSGKANFMYVCMYLFLMVEISGATIDCLDIFLEATQALQFGIAQTFAN